MARIFTDGAETGDISFWSSGNPTTSSVTPLSGSYHYVLGTSTNPVKSFSAVSEGYFRFRFNVASSSPVLNFRNATTNLLTLTFNVSLGKIVITNATTGDTGADSIIEDATYLLEVYYKISDTVGVVTIKLDGVQKFTFSGDTKPGAATTMDNIQFVMGSATTLWVDDIAMNDTTGGVDDSWCGDGKVILLTPNGNGDSSQWTGSDGNSTDNYLLVDELPPSNTDYVETSTTGNIDNYAMTTYALATGEAVLRVWSTIIVKDTAAAGTIKLGLKTESTNYVSTLNVGTSFARLDGTVHTVNPNTSSAWTQGQLDALQLTIEMP